MIKIGGYHLLFVALVVFSLLPFSMVNAHSVLEESTPAEGEELDENLKSIELSFNTKIENGSTLFLINDTGEEIQPPSIDITDNVLKATFQNSLEASTYQVNWKVIGADGHLIENQYSFTVKGSETNQSEENVTQIKDEQTDSSSNNANLNSDEESGNEINQDSEKQTTPEQQTSNDSEQTSALSVIIIFLIIVGILLVVWMLFGKRKK
ncbi:copper resistance CopC family protein [Oceanobacillus bengalensis]|uniref:Copper resistance protein CopC n=1 Tax=Oceanobacillus bengalensis TaxID=1435466 RepID=A0A494Z6Y6_9BACI|nr:copper resistance protein CopC [Oceanobacillus bengalensis]RKQ18313.1 copper resistance protein CopC [Oceanobacillus bengalensis]